MIWEELYYILLEENIPHLGDRWYVFCRFTNAKVFGTSSFERSKMWAEEQTIELEKILLG